MDKNTSDSSRGKKRQREDTVDEGSEIDHVLSLEENLTFSDTLVALRIMRAQFPHIDKVSIQPFILQSQLYSSVKDRTQVDRELESLRREKVLRIFKLNTGQDDHAIMILDDYLNQIERVTKRLEEKKQVYTLITWRYWFAIPNIGSVLKGLCQGRNEVLSLLKRKRYKEMMLAALEKKHLRFSPLDMRFHLRDLIGSGHLKTVQTPTGLLVRVSKD